MGKNVIVCLDGTGNQLKAHHSSNVVKLYQLLDLADPSLQVGYYDPGVGTFSAQGAWTPMAQRTTKLLGLAVGYGMRQNLGEAYSWLMSHYEEGDRLFLFGFSRGAYTARALAGMLKWLGLLRPGAENLVPYAVKLYTTNGEYDNNHWADVHDFGGSFSRKIAGRTGVPVDFIGLWDSVKAAGILRWDPHWPDTVKLSNAKHVRHAVSIDEIRRPYHEYLIVTGDKPGHPVLDETWFAGVHSDVGGGFRAAEVTVDGKRRPGPLLSNIALKWMVDGARADGLRIVEARYRGSCSLQPDDALATIHKMGKIWALATYRHRRVPPGARVHASVQRRVEADPKYAAKIPANVVWVDPNWLALAAAADTPTSQRPAEPATT
ncbi:MAG: DUF2235 domain-containing protein [Jatrophihabitantaceae bacterium]